MELTINPGELPQEQAPVKEKKKSKFGPGFWIIFFFAVIKDITDILLNLTVILSPVTTFTTFLMNAILLFYFFFVGVSANTRQVATFGISFIIDLIPGLNLFPLTTVNLFAIRTMEDRISNPK